MLKVEEVLIIGGLFLLCLAIWITNYGIIFSNNLMIPYICGFGVVFIFLGYHLKRINQI